MVLKKPTLLISIYPYTLLFFQLESYKESPRLTMQMEMPEAVKVTPHFQFHFLSSLHLDWQ